MSTVTSRIVIPYKDGEKASIVIARIEEPYGEGSNTVISVGCTLKDDPDNPTWKVHVPLNIAHEVADMLKQSATLGSDNPDHLW